jgi:hypothetical protein
VRFEVILKLRGLMRSHVQLVIDRVCRNSEDSLGTYGFRIDENRGTVENEAVIATLAQTILFDAPTHLHTVKEDVLVAEQNKACVPKYRVAVLWSFVLVPGLSGKEDRILSSKPALGAKPAEELRMASEIGRALAVLALIVS